MTIYMAIFRVALLSGLLWSSFAYSAFEFPPYNPRNAALAGSAVASTAENGNFLINPALSSTVGKYYGALNYSQLFNLPALRYANGLLVVRGGRLGAGLAVENLGGALYAENKITANLSLSFFGHRLSFGLSGHYYHISATGYPAGATAGLSLGFQYHASETTTLAGSIENINRPQLFGYSEELPQAFQFGIEQQLMAPVKMYLNVRKDRYFDAELSIGLDYQPGRFLKILSGYNSTANQPSMGLAFLHRRVEISYAMQYHSELGATHFTGIAFGGW